MHNVKVKSILSKNNGMNIYRGCTHGCIYCDSRSNVYNMNHDFEDLEVKENSIELLRKALQKKHEKCMIATGSMSDPYLPEESNLKYTLEVLRLIYKMGHGFTCITKSDLILRDLDLLSKINEKTKTVIQMTLTCTDDKISKIIEPNVCTTNRRIEVLEKLQEENIPTVVWLTPVLPYITDNYENINEILDACIQTNVKGIICFNMGLTLRDGNREYYYKMLDKHFLGLKSKYQKRYGNNYGLLSPNNHELMKLFAEKTTRHGILNRPNDVFDYIKEVPSNVKTIQTKLF